jgi:hypothetical protein
VAENILGGRDSKLVQIKGYSFVQGEIVAKESKYNENFF